MAKEDDMETRVKKVFGERFTGKLATDAGLVAFYLMAERASAHLRELSEGALSLEDERVQIVAKNLCVGAVGDLLDDLNRVGGTMLLEALTEHLQRKVIAYCAAVAKEQVEEAAADDGGADDGPVPTAADSATRVGTQAPTQTTPPSVGEPLAPDPMFA